MYASCSFKDYKFVTSSCSNDRRDRTKSTNVVALVSCDKDISGHKSFLSITDVNSEKELLLARAGIFSRQVTFKPLQSARFTAHLSGLAGTEGLKHVGFHRQYHIMERGDASCQKQNEV